MTYHHAIYVGCLKSFRPQHEDCGPLDATNASKYFLID